MGDAAAAINEPIHPICAGWLAGSRNIGHGGQIS